MPDFSALSLPVLGLAFLGAAAVVWFAGAKLAGYADEIADRSGLGHAVVGVLLLGAATSLPEIATTGVASLTGNGRMAVNNLIGGVSFQIVVLALADLFVRRGALTAMVPGPRTMLNAIISIVLLVLVTIGVMMGDWPIPGLGIGVFPLLIAVTYVLSVWLLNKEGSASGWTPTEIFVEPDERVQADFLAKRKLVALTTGAALAILLAGTVLTLSAEAMAEKSGLDTGLLGLTLLAAATSLPELSTSIAAVRINRAELAIGDVLGGNMFDIALVLLVDAGLRGGLALRQVDQASMTAALIGILLTAIFLVGLIERRDKAFLRMGYDSLAVLIVYIAGMGAIGFMSL
ncbi:hypothetical protein B2G71_04765 [Novosphingobium sp. PC22D]|uniref:sodium:calcium antiporter n=1 Tax=Novosphingobium sp. PC22D TaxID=1962403 RepID=UPI000BF18001|nr:hypothetical protein [Novosphingobium sp. PC22D]PEQ13643.1 hypothetical protein B2G71_04765 [Novosphingobium sp. PC22D]